jgi:myo-inositol-1(or 4)-monophosphatase
MPELPDLAQRVVNVVRTAIGEARPRLVAAALAADPGERGNPRHRDNFLTVHDLWMHDRYQQLLSTQLAGFVYASEEADPQVIGADPDPDLCVLVDPLDTSELAVRGLHGYTHVMIYSRRLRRPVAAVVGDIYHHLQIYVAARDDQGNDHAWLITADGDRHPLTTANDKPVSAALITNYLMRPDERFAPLARQHALLDALGQTDPDGNRWGRIGVDFGSVGLCHVAAGFTDAMIEFAKGFAIWDLAPGHYILHAAGGTILDLDGQPLSLNYHLDSLNDIATAMTGRQRFVAASNEALAHELAELISGDTRHKS